jgi:enoyl-CoA hydratase/carnithine racemase
MKSCNLTIENDIALLELNRGKVNALDEPTVIELANIFQNLANNPAARAVILTGHGKFFSFGWDVPALYGYPRNDFARFLNTFCRLCRDMFLFPKPLVAAINGHATAGGYILALACDYRIMAETAAKISLNEVTFGSAIPASTVEMLKYAAGDHVAEIVLLTGRMFSPGESLQLDLIDRLVPESDLLESARQKATELSAHIGPSYVALKRLIKTPTVDTWLSREETTNRDFIDLWYSPSTREMLKQIQIRS